mmetsp:Transcript_22363/g.21593  ORF Transcript_22363/g.21593 Transcript_22363/m.21593 type:complete len:161 (-) Transcript_22363:540-1022(-)
MVQVLPIVRCYQPPEELGSDLFTHQCYLATHIVYVFSDYGKHPLNRQLFSEEFTLIVSNMDYVLTTLKDVEVAGEFLHCLKILQYTKEADPELYPLVCRAEDFILKTLKQKKKHEKYKTYHENYCAIAGIMDYSFSQSDELRLQPPISTIFKFCSTTCDL